MKTLLDVLDKRPARLVWLLSFLLVLVLSGIAIAIGNISYLEPVFVLPIVVISWYGSEKAGLALAVVTAVILVFCKYQINATDLSMGSIILDGVVYLVSYSFLAVLITNFRSVHRVEEFAAGTDSLTRLPNARAFYAEFANELLRSIRYKHIFTLAYIDIDNFKSVNDSQGHSSGDELLIEVARCLKSSIRATDTVARLGGDEYVCLFPETEAEAAKNLFSKISQQLAENMQSQNWPVSFSVGMVTFETIPDDIKEAMIIADDLMYSVKNNKKNSIAYKVWRGRSMAFDEMRHRP
jgi:diguanylate cyclase (GGDEF)-like protein